jgi:hypothetical protein
LNVGSIPDEINTGQNTNKNTTKFIRLFSSTDTLTEEINNSRKEDVSNNNKYEEERKENSGNAGTGTCEEKLENCKNEKKCSQGTEKIDKYSN